MRASVAGQWAAWQGLPERGGKGLEVIVYYKGSGTILPGRVGLQDIDRELERIRSNASTVL
jgi:hypothetical protein